MATLISKLDYFNVNMWSFPSPVVNFIASGSSYMIELDKVNTVFELVGSAQLCHVLKTNKPSLCSCIVRNCHRTMLAWGENKYWWLQWCLPSLSLSPPLWSWWSIWRWSPMAWWLYSRTPVSIAIMPQMVLNTLTSLSHVFKFHAIH